MSHIDKQLDAERWIFAIVLTLACIAVLLYAITI